MTSSVESSSGMRTPQCALAFTRIVVGIWFVRSLFTKVTIALAWGFLPVPTANHRWIAVMPKLLSKYAADNPFGGYRDFLLHTVIPNAHIFAPLTGLGEAAVGLSLTLGLFTSVGAVCGMVQVIFYGLAVQHMSSGQQGFHVMLLAMMISFVAGHAGRCFGLDGAIRARWPHRWWARLG